MEIEFNPSRVPRVEPSQTAAQAKAPAPADATSFNDSTALLSKLKKLPDVRPEKVARARELISNSQYPPDDVLDRIAVLLATNVNA